MKKIKRFINNRKDNAKFFYDIFKKINLQKFNKIALILDFL